MKFEIGDNLKNVLVTLLLVVFLLLWQIIIK